ncbi:MAG TPA: HD domain-containing phosphohydrolase [Capsulimonadaceae bacterium]|nr:HD domain-containing phosphohydrolase [Capsulimonadaceae bacterium]
MRLSLRTKILLLVVGTVTVLSGIVLSALSLLVTRSIQQAVQADVRATRAILSGFIDERSRALTDQCLLAARQPWLRGVIGTEDPATVTDSVQENLKQLQADAVLVTDREGRLLGETDSPITTAGAVLRDPGTAAALGGKTWSGVIRRHGILTLAVSVPVYNGAYVCGSMTGYSAIDSKVASNLRNALGTDVAFVDRGRVVGASLILPARVDAPDQAPSVVEANGQRYFALYGPLPDAPRIAGVGFITMRSYDSIMEPYDMGRDTFEAVLAASLLLAILAGLGIAQNITRPLGRVVRAAQVVREGKWPERFEADRSDEIGLLQTVFNDMTASLQATQERLLGLIDTDLLTGLDNHRRFQEALAQEVSRLAISEEPLSLLLIDIDHFHQFNQENGHAAGDEALKCLADALSTCLPAIASIARYGGEEFAALLPQHTLFQAEAVAQSLREAVFRNLEIGATTRLTISVGCAEFGAHCKSPEELVLAAELAVSQAKQLGRDQVCRFDSVPGAADTGDPHELHRFLKDGSLATIQALAAAVDAKDPYTRGHSQSVAKYASALARHLGLAQEMVDLVHTAGTLHDVGKIGVPDGILNKPGRLDEAERKIMETHPVLGEVIVRKAPQLAATLPAVRHHHERWDGTGYPDRLEGEAIPYIARLLALADCYDAMTSDRPYRKGLPEDVALAEIRKNAGTQFEPNLARAFLAMMEKEAGEKRAA